MNDAIDFDDCFKHLTGYPAFPWQRTFYDHLVAGEFDAISCCRIPTGLGKTSTIPAWLIALANAPKVVPRRLAYVVNRRTVVDQSTDEAEKIRERLATHSALLAALQSLLVVKTELPLSISTLRGQFADNRQWLEDPTRPVIVAGTVDLVGSRLLFDGYRCGFKSKPTHAGMLGRDTLLIHDEAHLEPAFQTLLNSIRSFQSDGKRRLRVVELSATSRSSAKTAPLGLSPKDLANDEIQKRLHAKKAIKLHQVESPKESAAAITSLAMEHAGSGKSILIFVRSVSDVAKIANAISKELKKQKQPQSVATLTGTMRGLERDYLTGAIDCPDDHPLAAKRNIFQRFTPDSGNTENQETAFLVSTSAGEVGVNLSADHMVGDLSSYDSMTQRLGRVNRFGKCDSLVDIVHWTIPDPTDFEVPILKTLRLFQQLPASPIHSDRFDGSPFQLGDSGPLDHTERIAAFSPPPQILRTDHRLFDAWAMTTMSMRAFSKSYPGRPPIADWLHGVTDEIATTEVAWRREVFELKPSLRDRYSPNEMLDAFPIKPHEILSDRTDRVLSELKKLAEKHTRSDAWIVRPREQIEVLSLSQVVKRDKRFLENAMIVLSPVVGGLRDGMLDGKSTKSLDKELSIEERFAEDVSCELRASDGNYRVRNRLYESDPTDSTELPVKARCVFQFDPSLDGNSDDEHQVWRWYVGLAHGDEATAASWTSSNQIQNLKSHNELTRDFANAFCDKLEIAEPMRSAIISAAAFHDNGKARQLWQLGIGNIDFDETNPETAWAKSHHAMRPLNEHYRHELGSVIELASGLDSPEDSVAYDLILHFIAAHHGRARPHFPGNEVFDPGVNDGFAQKVADDVPKRFTELQQLHGRWELAWLESIVRLADAAASRLDEVVE